ncbi:ankyrin repeat-containing protein NPR4-like [Pistacia vera]|uniref:ankyrin repeat-containing protein NPR4-like n=1 Tax=Pistacia vera TaxID=55513 RepID=UPI001263235B|nr:ankyrin repeat-containing protein NPR4-like [Pistacia vera]
MKDYATAASASTSIEENVEIVITPPYQKMDVFNLTEIEKRNRHFKLCWAALEGDWNTAKRIYKEDNIDTQVKLSKDGDIALHIAAVARRTAASKRIEIVKAMMEKNEDIVKIRGDNDMLPLHKVALEGDKEMVEYLYEVTGDELLDNNDRFHLLVNLINHGLYDVALDLVERHPQIALARGKNKETALHLLARMPDLVVQDTDKEGNNILHLAAKFPLVDIPDIESSALHIQMQDDKCWFEAVKRISHPMYAEAKNKDGKTPRALFTEQHEELRNKADKYTKKIATACIMGSTLIATVVFAALFTLPGGTNESTGTPHFVQKASFIVFTISDTIALLLSSFSIIVFLAVISSRCEEADFLFGVRYSLALGLHWLLLSVKALIVAFCATMFIVFKEGLLWTPILVTVMAIFAIVNYESTTWTIYGEVMHDVYENR